MNDDQYNELLTRLGEQQNRIEEIRYDVESAVNAATTSAASAATSAAAAQTAAENAAQAAAVACETVAKTAEITTRILSDVKDIEVRHDKLSMDLSYYQQETNERLAELLTLVHKQQEDTTASRDKVIVAVLNAFMQQTSDCMKAIAQGNTDILKQVLVQ